MKEAFEKLIKVLGNGNILLDTKKSVLNCYLPTDEQISTGSRNVVLQIDNGNSMDGAIKREGTLKGMVAEKTRIKKKQLKHLFFSNLV